MRYELNNSTILPTNKIGITNPPLINGVLNFPLGMSVLFCKIKTPPQTSTNANKVPIEHKSVTMVKFMNKAGTATTNPTTMVANEGVLYFGCTFENRLGNKPSRLMLIHMRGCPIWNTNKTEAIATTALMEMIPAIFGK